MSNREGMGRALVLLSVLTLASAAVHAQRGGAAGQPGRGGGPASTGRSAAPFDLSGYWMALVTDDWRYRMLTPPKGNVDYLPVNAEARRVAGEWDPAADEAQGEQCRAFGAAGVMRLPTRLHISWDNDDTLRLETDAGTQTRLFRFGESGAASAGPPTWQGSSTARWVFPARGRGRGPATTGQLMVVTTGLRPGYLRKNGVPYSAAATLTEYFVLLVDNTGQQYLAVTTMVDDPQYLVQPYVKTYEFLKQADASGWNPTPCSTR